MSDISRLMELGLPTELAKEVLRQIANGTSNNAAVQAIAPLAGDADLAAVRTKVNAIIAALKGV